MSIDIKVEDIENLFFSEEFEKLNAYSSEFDIFKVMRIRSKELIHSNILASLLNPSESHGMGYAFLNQFIRSLKHTSMPDDMESSSLPLSVIISAQDSPVKIHRELDHIDLIIDFIEAKLVIAIENKIWAEEQNKQIQRYQNILEVRYKDYFRALVFLTPYGKNPETADKNSCVPVYCMPYSTISNICKISKSSANQLAAGFLEQFLEHLERYMSGKSEAKELCWQLFNKHKEAYAYIVKYYEECISRVVEDKFDEIEKRIQTESTFSKWHGKFEITRDSKKTGKQIVNLDLDLRLKEWPEGIWIKVYKHISLAVFPYVKKENIEHIEKYLETSPEPSKYWPDHFYFSKLSNLNSDRYITYEGNEMDNEDINTVLNKVYKHINDIESMIKNA